MTTPTREAIQTFISITGASESLALRKLESIIHNLHNAIQYVVKCRRKFDRSTFSKHLLEKDPVREYGGNLNEAVSGHFLEVERNIANSAQPISSQYDSVEMDSRSGGRRSGILPLMSSFRSFRPSLLLDSNYRRNLFNQIGVSSMNNRANYSQIGDMRDTSVDYNSGNEHQHLLGPRHPIELSTGTSSYYPTGISNSVLQNNDLHLNSNAAESEMMQAAIEASKRDFEAAYLQRQHDSSNRLNHEEDEEEELAHALSMSLKTAEEEKAIRERMKKSECEQIGPRLNRTETANGNLKAGSSSIQHSDPDSRSNLQHSIDSLFSHEWGDISPKELDEAIMLETQLFSQISEGSLYCSPQEPGKPHGPDRIEGPGAEAALTSNLSSSTLMAQRSLREQQDNEYRASLLADREKELNARKEAEISSLCQRKKFESENHEKPVVAKDTSLPPEPATDDENAVTLLVRMPDGSRDARRFRKSDKLQLLFDFIDFSKLMKPGSYRVVRPYPRRAFSVDDCSSSLNELGLTNKQEALFLEPM